MNSPVIHDALLLVVLTGSLRLRPLVAVEFAVALTPRTFLAGLITIRLHPAGFAGAAVDPAGMAFAQEESGTDVVAGGTMAGDVQFDGRLHDAYFARCARHWLWFADSWVVEVFAWSTSFALGFGHDGKSRIVNFCDGSQGGER